jgi:dihydroorotase
VFRREAQQQLECGGEANRTRPARQRPSIGSDHAPHTGEEKNWPDPESPWGVPGVQTLLPVMLPRGEEQADAGAPRRSHLRRASADLRHRRRGRIALGHAADYTMVDLKKMITNRWIASRCGWTPFDGITVTGPR